MPVSFRILPERGLVYVRYEGEARVDESFAAIAEYMRHPDYAPHQKQLVDLSAVTGFEVNWPKLFELQARKAEMFLRGQGQVMIVYYAPTELTARMARMAIRSWEHVPSVVTVLQQREADALAVLGQPEDSFEELLQRFA